MDDTGFLTLAISASNMAGLVALVFTLLLLGKSLMDFTQTGPQMRAEVLAHYQRYLIASLARLTLAAFLLSFILALPGTVSYLMGLAILDVPYSNVAAALAAAASLGLLSVLQFCRMLLRSPGVIVASLHYSPSRLYPLWEHLSEPRLKWAARLLLASYAVWLVLGIAALMSHGEDMAAFGVLALHASAVIFLLLFVRDNEPLPIEIPTVHDRPNILMLGSDTLRADRLGTAGYRRALTPNLDRLAAGGAMLEQCYVPCARTAPSLLSLLTGMWPHHHGIRDNFVADAQAHLDLLALPDLLTHAGYHTAALGDWAAADLGKFDLGFREVDVPADQWNLKFFLRQGPKDIRLFLSLFSLNAIGKFFLEEIYFLAGVPLTRQLGLKTRQILARLGQGEQPFFLNVFMASTHPPFASEYPYYTLFADPAYRGPSKFAMARLTDPFEIIRRQGEPREEFDLDQILDLYDGCVKSFDDEVGRILDYMEKSGLTRNTLVLVYSDHGMEFFEHGTWGQGNSAIGDFSARVPVILSGPLISQPVRLNRVTRTVDIAPTLLDLLGLPPNHQMDGHSLVAALRGEAPPDLPALYETGIWLTDLPGMPAGHLRYPDLPELLEIPDRATGTMALKPEYQRRVLAAKDRMIRQGDWKLVYQPLENSHLLRLYDVNHDPGCTRDVITQHPDIGQILWQKLQVWMSNDGYVGAASAANPLPSSSTPIFAPKGAPTDKPQHTSPVTRLDSLRNTLLSTLRRLDDWIYTRLARHARVLFVLSDGYGFACQAPVIRALLNYPDVVVRTTTDRGQQIGEVEFASPSDRELFVSLYVSTQRARLMKWHMVVDTHMNGFYPARNALRAYMHHGPGFGIMGNKTAIIEQCDIFFGLSDVEHQWFERLNPGIFGGRRTFIPVGFPKNDALSRGEFDRAAILESLGLPDRKTLLITSHWQEQSTLRRLGFEPFQKLAAAFPEFNVIQTGHPWLWQANRKVSAAWQEELLKSIHEVEADYTNARFVQTSDVESLLAVADLLVGDYSSVMTSYSLLDRPIVFFNDPEFQFSIAELKQVFIEAAHSFSDMEGLLPACIDALNNPEAKFVGRRTMRQTFYNNEGHSGTFTAKHARTAQQLYKQVYESQR
jgi:arylsulfatase A-like enzyme